MASRINVCDWSLDCDSNPPAPPRFAIGTHNMERVPHPATEVAGPSAEDVAQLVHDLKSPLGAIALESELLNHLVTDRRGEVDRTVVRIKCNLAFIERVLSELLDLCTLDAGSFELQRMPTELRVLVERVLDRVATRERERVHLEIAGPMTLVIDPLRIERVVDNLLANALKYAPSGSGIVIRVFRRTTSCRVCVIDGGPGVSPDEATFIFDKYARTSRAQAMPGSGLGLYISKRIVEAHGGRIGVESVPGIGSSFYFELPDC